MLYLVWLAPSLAIAMSTLSGRTKTSAAAFLGLCLAVPVALLTAPQHFNLNLLQDAVERGVWVGITITPYILGGLLFWKVASPDASPGAVEQVRTPQMERGTVFLACFLIGPFAESATGFGVGMLATIAVLRRFGLPPKELMLFALLSQTLIPWGAMGSGTLLAAAYANMSSEQLGLYSSVLTSSFMLVLWLPMYWICVKRAGFATNAGIVARELVCTVIALALLTIATGYLGAEIALLASFGPLIAIYYLLLERPSSEYLSRLVRVVMPYVLLIGSLMMMRMVPALKNAAVSAIVMRPYPDLPAWAPLFHAGSWLIAGAVICAFAKGNITKLWGEGRDAWRTGKHSVLAVFIFSMLSEVMSKSGISDACASGLFSSLGTYALLVTPALSAFFGVLANTGNAPNSLFMSSQIALASSAGLNTHAVAALQHVSGTSMGIFSPVRMSIAASLSQGYGNEKQVYAVLFPYAVIALLLLTLVALGITALN